MGKQSWYLIGLFSVVLLVGCAPKQGVPIAPPQSLGNAVQDAEKRPTPVPSPTPTFVISKQVTTPTTVPTPKLVPGNIPTTGVGPAPYGPPPALTAEESDLTQKLFALINSDRAARGLYPFVWNDILAGGARLHSWNMAHCGFSHTCPDGLTQCQRIAAEGFAGYTDCGENIGYAGPYPTAWSGVTTIQESMMNEPPTGWHRIHLTSTTLHRIGVGIYVDTSGYIWFTEDMVS